MADLITHMASALLVKAITGKQHTPALVAGVVLPDLAGRVPVIVLGALINHGVPLPELLPFAFGVLHMPLGMVPLTLLLALLFKDRERVVVWANLTAGCFLHLGVDVLQRHVGTGYPLLFPFTQWHWELGWISSEATVPVAPVLAVASVVLWLWRFRWRPAARDPDQKGTSA